MEPDLAKRYPITCADIVCGAHVPTGWSTIVHELLAKLEKLATVNEPFRVQQIKEKFGGLRVYLGAAPDEAHLLIIEAEKLASVTCQRCGEPGETKGSSRGWIVTACERH
jgi:hypothetical protein